VQTICYLSFFSYIEEYHMNHQECLLVWFVPIFRLDRHSGQLYINGRIVPDEYDVSVKVYDVIWRSEVISTVTVHVKEIADDALLNSGSVRLRGLYQLIACSITYATAQFSF